MYKILIKKIEPKWLLYKPLAWTFKPGIHIWSINNQKHIRIVFSNIAILIYQTPLLRSFSVLCN